MPRCRGGIEVVVAVAAVITVKVVAVSLVVADIDVLGLTAILADACPDVVVVVELVDVVLPRLGARELDRVNVCL